MDYELLYQRALEEITFRQEFLNQIDLKEYKRYITKIIYKHKSKKDKRLMWCKPVFSFNIFKPVHSKIIVFVDAFDPQIHVNFADFYCSLIFHEGFHAFENYYNHHNANYIPPISAPHYDLFFDLRELRAYENQSKHLTAENINGGLFCHCLGDVIV